MKKFVQVKYAGMPNIIMNQLIIPELLQDMCTPKNLVDATKKIINNQVEKETLLEGYQNIRKRLGESGASLRAAKYIINYDN